MKEIPKFRPRKVDEQWRRYWRKSERTTGQVVPGLSRKDLKKRDLSPEWVLENLERCPICGRPMVSPVPDPTYGKICWSCYSKLTGGRKRY